MTDDTTPTAPLIPRSRAPWRLRMRDALLTVVAWLLFALVIRDALLAVLGALAPEAAPRAAAWLQTRLAAWLDLGMSYTPGEFRALFVHYLYAAGAFVAWLVLWGWLNRARLRGRAPEHVAAAALATPAALTPAEHAIDAGLDELAPEWRRARILAVAFDAAGRIVQVSGREPRLPAD